ncbi:uncharacterized protein LOC127258505 [Andrographis paniculata]|uniref:uncharacterized protein LOC127258505 n=1 Tax=Andrographis paniculata TaxID=175694 RepID=UPI0021E9A6D7|nr:uncharacterized protein LOC127258505 [Andrographis paniculata]XP_051141320.1 uncharacterized protein LOC127258505 [Andrographis paniculata]XP_051141321.1 uncharacterized protein LOC127258505 [Andrographis paniculata]
MAAEMRPKDAAICDDLQEIAFPSHCCCFSFNFPCFESDNWERISTTGGEQQEQQEFSARSSWWVKGIDALKKIRELSELAAGPKWKTFIRRFNKSACKSKPSKFQYDAFSYSLNFDEGIREDEQLEGDVVLRDFSSRYAAFPASNSAAQSKDAAT